MSVALREQMPYQSVADFTSISQTSEVNAIGMTLGQRSDFSVIVGLLAAINLYASVFLHDYWWIAITFYKSVGI